MKGNKLFQSIKPRTKCYDVGNSRKSRENLHPVAVVQQESKESCLKCRHVAALIGFFLFFLMAASRMNISVGIVAMVNNSAISNQTLSDSDSCSVPLNLTSGSTTNSESEYSNTGEFIWSPEIQGYILGSYYLMYVIVQVPAGKLTQSHGCKWIAIWGTLLAAVSTLLIPTASRIHPYVLIFMQILRGLGQGVYQSSCSLLAANWFPKMERGLLYTFIQSGAPLGSFLGSIFAGLLCKSLFLGGWPSSFYVFGTVGLIFAAAIAYILHETPSVHPAISEAELKYILSNQENALSRKRPDTPWREIFSSVPVYALAVGYFGQIWMISQFQVVHSTFLGTILHYQIDDNGLFSALPFMLMFAFTQISGWTSSYLTNKKYASVDQARKSCNFISCLGYSVCLVGVYFAGCNKFWSTTFSVLSAGFTGVGLSGSRIVSADMSPNFAASINAISCTFGCLPSFILPIVVGYLTDERQTLEQWNKVFFISIGIVMISGFVFSIFGSAEIQSWNFVEEDRQKDEDKNIRY